MWRVAPDDHEWEVPTCVLQLNRVNISRLCKSFACISRANDDCTLTAGCRWTNGAPAADHSGQRCVRLSSQASHNIASVCSKWLSAGRSILISWIRPSWIQPEAAFRLGGFWTSSIRLVALHELDAPLAVCFRLQLQTSSASYRRLANPADVRRL